jgi:hypothetical protein
MIVETKAAWVGQAAEGYDENVMSAALKVQWFWDEGAVSSAAWQS